MADVVIVRMLRTVPRSRAPNRSISALNAVEWSVLGCGRIEANACIMASGDQATVFRNSFNQTDMVWILLKVFGRVLFCLQANYSYKYCTFDSYISWDSWEPNLQKYVMTSPFQKWWKQLRDHNVSHCDTWACASASFERFHFHFFFFFCLKHLGTFSRFQYSNTLIFQRKMYFIIST